jgi:hypothetical protein
MNQKFTIGSPWQIFIFMSFLFLDASVFFDDTVTCSPKITILGSEKLS